ncbi:MAG TPA: hypothetical protein VJ654_19280 [Noviherbaspirillum sp.]|nr:hypothetical protein [Noviherbaspirillum sp.]
MVLSRPFLLVALACRVSAAFASPTSDEFMQCHRVASSALLRCLDQSPGLQDDKCWESTRSMNDACYDRVRKDYRPDTGRIEAEKRTNEQRRKGRDVQ